MRARWKLFGPLVDPGEIPPEPAQPPPLPPQTNHREKKGGWLPWLGGSSPVKTAGPLGAVKAYVQKSVCQFLFGAPVLVRGTPGKALLSRAGLRFAFFFGASLAGTFLTIRLADQLSWARIRKMNGLEASRRAGALRLPKPTASPKWKPSADGLNVVPQDMSELQDPEAPVQPAGREESAMGALAQLAGGPGSVPDVGGGGAALEEEKAGQTELSGLQSLMEKVKGLFGGGSPKGSPSMGGGNRIALAKGFNRSFDSTPMSTGRGSRGGRLSAMKKTPVHRSSTGPESLRKGTAQRAMGQLKMASFLSKSGKESTSGELASSNIAAAFDQQTARATELSVLSGTPQDGPDNGQGTSEGLSHGQPDFGEGQNVTPYQDDVEKAAALDEQGRGLHDQAEDLKDNGNDLKDKGDDRIQEGYYWIAAGASSLPWPHGYAMIAYGVKLVKEGSAMKAQGNMLLDQSAQKEDQSQGKFAESRETADHIEQEHGQEYQSHQIHEDADNSPVTETQEQPKSTVQQDVHKEQNADYELKK
ncbi:MAG TPA: hypothetical protein DCM05_07595 [Elusimicrobia bacterium]|nr:hypothetical protein [Elusimicrobiota bacterium]